MPAIHKYVVAGARRDLDVKSGVRADIEIEQSNTTICRRRAIVDVAATRRFGASGTSSNPEIDICVETGTVSRKANGAIFLSDKRVNDFRRISVHRTAALVY